VIEIDKKMLVVAPHPDDETFGCGGTILRATREGIEVHWLIVTTMRGANEYTQQQIEERDALIQAVTEAYGFAGVHQLGFTTARLDGMGLKPLVDAVGEVMAELRPTDVYAPFRHDIHSDHRQVFDAVAACSKWFRFPGTRRFLSYETLSETDFCVDPGAGFNPTVFIDISSELPGKLEIVRLYPEEIGEHPFPRSAESCRSLAQLRGSQSGCRAAEAFQLIRENM
jgi:LmbE family N-acetylglucosaminyl deacetylase